MLENGYDPFIYTDILATQYHNLLNTKNPIPFAAFVSFVLVFSLLIFSIIRNNQSDIMTRFYNMAAVSFVIILLVPFINDLTGIFQNSSIEKRTIAQAPQLNIQKLSEFGREYENYYNDNFSFRTALIKAGGYIKYKCFGVSSVTDKAAVGTNGWIYLNGPFYNISNDLAKNNLYTKKVLAENVKIWVDRKRDLNKMGIKYYRAFWPDKHNIYPEFMPNEMKWQLKDTLARCDQALNYLKETQSDFELLDVRAVLLEKKKKTQLFYKHDSHWNSFGAYYAYYELLKMIQNDFEQLKPKPLSDFNITWNFEPGGDLETMVGGLPMTELKPKFVLKTDTNDILYEPITGYPVNTFIVTNKKAQTNLSVLIYRDSFSTALSQFYFYHFKKVTLIWGEPFSFEMVDRVKPDIVVESYVSRYFN